MKWDEAPPVTGSATTKPASGTKWDEAPVVTASDSSDWRGNTEKPTATIAPSTARAQAMAKSEVGEMTGLDAFTRGMTLGFEPDIEAGVVGAATGVANVARGIAGAPIPYSAAEAAKATREQLDTSYAEYKKTHPYYSTAAELVGGMASPITRVGAEYIKGARPLAEMGVSELAKMGGRAATVGAGVGAVAGASDAKDRTTGAIKGAETGAEFGFATPFVSSAVARGLPIVAPFFKRVATGAGAGMAEIWDHISSAFKPHEDADKITPEMHAKAAAAALDYVHRLTTTLKSSPEKLRATDPLLRQKSVTAGEAMGRGGIAELTTAGRVSGTSADLIESALRQRNQSTAERVQGDLAEAAGIDPSIVGEDLDVQLAALKQKADPLYDIAFTNDDGSPRIYDTPKIRELLRKPAVKDAFGRVIRSLRNLGEDPHVIGFDLEPVIPPDRSMEYRLPAKLGEVEAGPTHELEGVKVRIPTVKLLHYVKSGATALLHEKAKDPITGAFKPDWFQSTDAKVLKELRDELVRIPEYDLANGAGGDIMQMQDALNTTPKIMSPNVSEHDFLKRWNTFTQAHQETAAGAAVQHLYAKVRNGTLRTKDFNAATNPALYTKIVHMFGETGAQKFAEHMQAETKLTAWANRIMPGVGSHTAEVQAGEERAAVGMAKSLGYAGVAAGHHNLIGFLGHLMNAGSYYRATMLGHMDAATRQEVTRLLLLPPEKLAGELDKVIENAAQHEKSAAKADNLKKMWAQFRNNPAVQQKLRQALVTIQEQSAQPDNRHPGQAASTLGLQSDLERVRSQYPGNPTIQSETSQAINALGLQ